MLGWGMDEDFEWWDIGFPRWASVAFKLFVWLWVHIVLSIVVIVLL
jgi:hypothetical protein